MTHLGLPSLLTGPSRKKRKGSVLLCAMFLKELWGSEQSAPIASNSKQGKTHTSLSPHPHKTTAMRGFPAGSSWNVLCWFLALQKINYRFLHSSLSYELKFFMARETSSIPKSMAACPAVPESLVHTHGQLPTATKFTLSTASSKREGLYRSMQ